MYITNALRAEFKKMAIDKDIKPNALFELMFDSFRAREELFDGESDI